MEEYKLTKPFEFDKAKYEKLDLDFESLTGNDFLAAERQLVETGTLDASPVKELSKSYQAAIVAKAAKVPIELIQALPIKDFSKLTMKAQNFLLE